MAAQANQREMDLGKAGRRMILGDGICTIFAREDVSGRGEMPRFAYRKRTQSYFANLDFASGTMWTTQGREDVVIDARIRVLQDRAISPQDVVTLQKAEDVQGHALYEIDRVWHGRDEESGMLISDLNLRRVSAR